MWPFSKSKASVGWLEKADAALILAFQTHTPGNLSDFLTRNCLVRMMERIRNTDKQKVGMERYKKVQWHKINDTNYQKQVTFEDVNMGAGLYIPLGDPYVEDWTLESENDKTKVSDIRRISNG